MEKQQQRNLLDSIGGEPLDGSGFESEEAVTEDERVLTLPDQLKGDDL